MSASWKRRHYGWLSPDGEWFAERGAPMPDASGTAWLVWRRVREADGLAQNSAGSWYTEATLGTGYCRTTAELTGNAEDSTEDLWVHVGDAGWLSEAKLWATDASQIPPSAG